MKTLTPYKIFTILLALVLLSGIACHLIFPYGTMNTQATGTWYCSLQFYRGLPGGEEFTEDWECYFWPKLSPGLDLANIVTDYVSNYMAPGLAWDFRNFTLVQDNSKLGAADCTYPYPPPTYGAPRGAKYVWTKPPTTQAYVDIWLKDKDGVVRTATPQVAEARMAFAERTGLPDWSAGGEYISGKRHVRFSDLCVDLDTPFWLGSDLKVHALYVQSVGTIIAEGEQSPYIIGTGDAKFYFYAFGEKSGEDGTTSFCEANQFTTHPLTMYQGEPNPKFALYWTLTSSILGQDMIVKIGLSKPDLIPFDTHQPVVYLDDQVATSLPIDLIPDYVFDHDDDLQKFLWFEDFEASNEKFLGKGDPSNNGELKNLYFSGGEHKITLVAYDSKGSYNSDTMILTVQNTIPKAEDDYYTVDEDSVLDIDPPGVLANDTDPDGDILSMWHVPGSGPDNGVFSWSSTGSFTYIPDPDYYGLDIFEYKANDGKDYSNVGTVTIQVNPVNDKPVALDDAFLVKEDSVLSISAPGILANDSDVDLDALDALLDSGPSEGTLNLNSDGSFTYTPNANYYGADSFTYEAYDGTTYSNIATVTITVIEVPPGEESKDLSDKVTDLVDTGALNDGQGNSLTSKLDKIVEKLEKGRVNVVCNLLQAFINEVNSLISEGVLLPGEGQPLIEKAKNIMAELGCL
ncbi:cadherin-like domain-containing protein [Planctomycetota bacterium]